MTEDFLADYLAGLPAAQREILARVNGVGLAALRGYLASGEAVAFLGAGASASLYPLWDGLIGDLVDAASGRLTDKEAATCRVMARESQEEAVELEIMETLLRYDLQWAVQTAEKWAAAPLSAEERLYYYICDDMQHLIQSPYFIQGLYSNDVMEDPSFEYWHDLRSRLRKAVRTMIRDGIQSNEFVSIDPIFVERVISWFLLGTHRMFNRAPITEGIEPEWKPDPGLLKAAAGIMLRGILTDSARAASLPDEVSVTVRARSSARSVHFVCGPASEADTWNRETADGS